MWACLKMERANIPPKAIRNRENQENYDMELVVPVPFQTTHQPGVIATRWALQPAPGTEFSTVPKQTTDPTHRWCRPLRVQNPEMGGIPPKWPYKMQSIYGTMSFYSKTHWILGVCSWWDDLVMAERPRYAV